jgi:hypothetical protein
MDLNE